MAASTFVNLVRVYSNSAGTGPLVLGLAENGFRGTEALTDGATYSYLLQTGVDNMAGNAAYETGRGVWNAATSTLTRNVIESSLNGQPIGVLMNSLISITVLAQDFAATDQAALAAAVLDAQGSADDAAASAASIVGDVALADAAATAAGVSATNAANSATLAGTKADAASASATTAGSAATSANNAATNANGSAIAAAASATDAAGSVAAVDASATAAENSATAAAGSATSAGLSASSADAYSVAAGASATAAHNDRLQADADAAATAADRAAVNTDRIIVEGDALATAADRTATHTDRLAADADAVATAADRVQTGLDRTSTTASAASAGTAATTATTAATTATTQAGIATTQAGIATTQAGNAGTSATAAAGSATAASGSATAAAGSATAAGTSATSASNSATTATSAATNAATSATSATSSATTASTAAASASGAVAAVAASASVAATAATTATTSATSASASAVSAAASQVAAAISAGQAAAVILTAPSLIQPNSATPTVPPSGSSSGGQYWAASADGLSFTLYLNTSGTGAPVSPTTQVATPAAYAALKAGVSRTQISRLGSPGALVTGAGATANITWIGDDAAAQTGTVNTIRFWAATGGTIKIKRYTLSGSTYTYVATAVASLTVVAGLNVFNAPADFTAFPINAGDHIGIYSSSAVSTSIGTAGTGWLATNAAGDNTTTATRSNVAGAYFQVNLDISYPALMNVASEIDAEAATRSAADTTLTNALTRTLYSIFGSNPIVTAAGTAAADKTWIGDDAAPQAGTVTQIQIWANGPGTVKIKRYSLLASTFTYLATVATLNVIAGLNTFNAPADFTAFAINVGDHIGIYSSTSIIGYSPTAGTGWLSTAATGDNTTTATRSVIAGAYFQINVKVGYPTLLNVDSELQQRPSPFASATDNASYFLINEDDASGWQQVYSIRKSDGTVFPLTSGTQHSSGSLLSSDATIAAICSKNADGTETSYIVPIEGPPSSAFILHSRKDFQCWGDSLTFGATISNPSVNGWVAKLAAAMGRQAYNGGVSGETSTQIKTRMVAASQSLRERTAFLWSGTNNPSVPSTVISDTNAMIAAMVGKSKRFIVLPCFNADTEGVGTGSYNTKMALNAALAAAYPGNYYDIRSYLATTQALTDAGLTPDATDLANIAADIIPHQLRGDTLHPNATCATLIATKLQAQIVLRNW